MDLNRTNSGTKLTSMLIHFFSDIYRKHSDETGRCCHGTCYSLTANKCYFPGFL